MPMLILNRNKFREKRATKVISMLFDFFFLIEFVSEAPLLGRA